MCVGGGGGGPLSTLLHLFAKQKGKKLNKVQEKRKEPGQLLVWMFWMGAISRAERHTGTEEGWRDGERSAERKKKKSTALKFIAEQQREIEWLGENGGEDTADNHFRCLAASTTARHSISLGMMLRYSDRVAAPLLLCNCTCG